MQALQLEGNSIAAVGALALAEALRRNSGGAETKTKSLADWALCSVPRVFTLRVLIRLIGLREINLNLNQIGDNGIASLADGLTQNVALRVLHVGGTGIGDAGAIALSESLQVNIGLQELTLSRNRITDIGANALANALQQNTALRRIDLTLNSIGTKGIAALVNALRTNKQVVELSIGYNSPQSDDGELTSASYKHEETEALLTQLNAALLRNNLHEQREKQEGGSFP